MARDGLTVLEQTDFSAGAFPGMEHVPSNGVEDILNGVVDRDLCVYRRGGSSHKTSGETSQDLTGLWDGYLLAGRRTVMNGSSMVAMLAGDDVTPQQLAGSVVLSPTRWTQVANLLIRPLAPPTPLTLLVAGGAYPFNGLSAGTATVTNGSATVTGAGTNWGGTGRAGSVLTMLGGGRPAAVRAAVNDTTLTLVDPWPYDTITAGAYNLQAAITYASPDASVANVAYQSHVSQMYGRLVLGNANRVSFTHFATVGERQVSTLDFDGATDFHLLPEGVVVTGLEPWRDTMLVFTTAGVWGLTGLAFDIVDAAGNLQQQLQPVARDVVLWGELGLAVWGGALIIPAADDLLVFDGGAPTPMTGGAQRLYRSYVRAGYQPGQAAVYRGHYLLPVLDGALQPVDLLTWRLDMPGAPFARWGGHGGRVRAFAVRSGDAVRQSVLFGAADRRVDDFSRAFAPGSSDSGVSDFSDADGSSYDLEVTLRTLTAGTRPRQWRRFRARTEQESSGTQPVWEAEYATGRPDDEFFPLPDPQVRGGR